MTELLHRVSPAAAPRWSMAAVADVVRAHREPWVHVPDAAVHEALTARPERYLAHLRRRLSQLAAGELALDLPSKRIFADLDGDFRVMPCVTGSGPAAVKTVKVVGTNLLQRTVPDQITVGKALRLDPLENFVTHVFDACLLSSARTGACAVLALQRLAPTARRVALVGAGRVGFYAAVYLEAAFPGLELVVADERPERAIALARVLEGGGVDCRFGDARHVDAVVLATTSRTPFLRPAETSAACVVSVGADAEDQHELAREWTKAAELFVDSPDAFDVGDVRAWSAASLLDGRPRDLMSLFRSSRPEVGRSVFVSTGSALFDNLTIEYLLL